MSPHRAALRDVPPNTIVSGSPAIDNRQWLRAVAAFTKLPELAKAVRKLDAEIEPQPVASAANFSATGKMRGSMDEDNSGVVEDERNGTSRSLSAVLLLDDREDNLIVRSAILRQKGYAVLTSKSVEEAEAQLDDIDIAVLDYNLGSGKFGTEVAESLRRKRPQVPIIILSATLERKFGGIADMHLLKGYSSVDDLVAPCAASRASSADGPVVVDARDFFYSRISMAMGDDVALEILDRDGNWQYVNDYFASLSDKQTQSGFREKICSKIIPSWATNSARSSAR